MSAIKRKMCDGKSVRLLCTQVIPLLLLYLLTIIGSSSSLAHKMGHVEAVPKEINDRSQKGVSTVTMTRRLIEPDTTSRDGLFGTKINNHPVQSSSPPHYHHRSPPAYVNVPLKSNTSRRDDSFIPHYYRNHTTRDTKLTSEMINKYPEDGGATTTHRSSPAKSVAPVLTSSSKKSIIDAVLKDKGETVRTSLNDMEVNSKDFRNNMMGGFLKREVWTIPLLSMAAINIFLISLFEIYVLCKARGPSRRHLFLGQMLLFALFLCSSLALVFAICPSAVSCFLGRLGLGIAYTLIFSVLMVKCIFLLSLDGGIYLPASYQACLLLFSVLVQVAIDTQWVIVYPPYLKVNQVGGPLWPQCGTSYTHLLLTLSYNVFLIGIVGVLAFKTRGIRENYRESTYIGISVLVTIPIWISWTIAGWILQGRHQDACVAFGLLAQSLATFLIMFMPKGRQLAAMGKEGMYLEDQEDQCSGYSPSFFHFKPSKSYKTALIGDALSNGHFYRFINEHYNAQQFYYPPSSADGNVYTTLEPTISTINPNVFFHRSDFHPGMIY